MKRLPTRTIQGLDDEDTEVHLPVSHADIFRRTLRVRVMESLRKEKEPCKPQNNGRT